MITLARLLSYPQKYNHLTNKIKEVQLETLQDHLDEGIHKISATANGHDVEIYIYGDIVNAESPVKISCGCDFFKYNLAYALSKVDALLHPEQFILKPPKKLNTTATLSPCKHIALVAQTIYQNRSFMKR